ncbi:hypothetical protein [Niabella hibiscisoli]|uniref:hypothetical protein n=1 Tax=Niabella hibiscisoli TaxID=1825928 RepID=UPI001F0EEC57|nr:hypothetical protein [Niabella hibiscisoli]MCH5716548.1 hypothetical protein [Niabella hibiscisoli]
MKIKSIYTLFVVFLIIVGNIFPSQVNATMQATTGLPSCHTSLIGRLGSFNCSGYGEYLSIKPLTLTKNDPTKPYLKLNILDRDTVVVEEDNEQKIVEVRGDIVLHFYTDATMQYFGNAAYVTASISITGASSPLITTIEEVENYILYDATLSRSHYYKDGSGNWVFGCPAG